MASTVVGRIHRLAVSNDGGSTFFDLVCLQDATLNVDKAQIDNTCKGDGQFKNSLDGHLSGTIDGQLAWDETDAGQVIVSTSTYGSADIVARWRMQTSSGLEEQIATVSVATWTAGAPIEGLSTVNMSLQLKGDFSPSAQP